MIALVSNATLRVLCMLWNYANDYVENQDFLYVNMERKM